VLGPAFPPKTPCCIFATPDRKPPFYAAFRLVDAIECRVIMKYEQRRNYARNKAKKLGTMAN
jgi:hypothetical protein